MGIVEWKDRKVYDEGRLNSREYTTKPEGKRMKWFGTGPTQLGDRRQKRGSGSGIPIAFIAALNWGPGGREPGAHAPKHHTPSAWQKPVKAREETAKMI